MFGKKTALNTTLLLVGANDDFGHFGKRAYGALVVIDQFVVYVVIEF